jgi:glycosyltransferase involved in cell wall biosynthesis
MRVVAIGHYTFPPGFDGAAVDHRYWLELARRVGEIDLVVRAPAENYLWTARPGDDSVLRVWGVAARPRRGDRLDFVVRAAPLTRRLAAHADVVNGCEPVGGLIALRCARGAAFVQEVHGRLLDMPRGYPALKRAGLRRTTVHLCRRARAVRAVSEEVASSLRGAGIPAEKIRVIGQRCDTTVFDPARFARRHHETPVVGFVGRLVPDKAVDVLIKAAAPLVREGKAVLKLAGDGRLRRPLEALARGEMPGGGYEFVGALDHDDVAAFLAGVDVVAIASRSEGMPRALLEAMAMARPVVASTVGGMAEVVDHRQTGLLVPPDDVGALERALRELVVDHTHAAELGARARQSVRERYEYAEAMDRLASFYKAVAG